jgi:hypothetical protein
MRIGVLVNEVADVDIDSDALNAKQVRGRQDHDSISFKGNAQPRRRMCLPSSAPMLSQQLIDLDPPSPRRGQRNAAVGVRSANLAGGCACCMIAGAFSEALATLVASSAYHELDYLVGGGGWGVGDGG